MEKYQRIKDLREDTDKSQQDIADIFGALKGLNAELASLLRSSRQTK